MEFNVKTGTICRQEYEVREEHTAKHVGSGDVEVLSTPSMILFMENTSLNCIQQFLPPEYTTVGISVNVKHLNPAPRGEKVLVEAEIAKVEGRKVFLRVKTMWKNLVIGEGEHTRYIVEKERFLNKVRKLIEENK